jgi:hypothetical protein
MDLVRGLAIFALVVVMGCSPAATMAQSNSRHDIASLTISNASDRVANQLVFESEAITIRHITLPPDVTGYEYHHPGGSIILLQEYAYKIPIPMSGTLDGQLKVGDVIQIAAGNYILENPTPKTLDFLSIERKR